jgi:hypothetical protein
MPPVATKTILRYFSDALAAPRCACVQQNDLMALLCGVKDVLYANIVPAQAAAFRELCSDFRLKTESLVGIRNIGGESAQDVLVGWDKKKLLAARKAYADILSAEWGIALGYPECCVKSYLAWKADQSRDLVLHILHNSARGRLLDFRLNNVYNYFSRLENPGFRSPQRGPFAPVSDGEMFRRFLELNRGVNCEPVLPWHPCAYDCKKSLSAAKKLFGFMEACTPLAAAARRKLLSRPVVFRDKFDFAALSGGCSVSGGVFRLEYGSIAAPLAFPGGNEKSLLESNSVLKCRSGKTPLFPSGGALPRGYALLPFSAAP